MWIISVLFFLQVAFALSSFEELKDVKILKVLPKNIVMVDRGIEDGLMRNDHVMFSTEDIGYSSRGLCLQSKATTSYWKLYRIPNGAAFSKDLSYTISGLADREIPYQTEKIRDEEITFPEEKKPDDPGENPFEVKRDLPQRLTERDLLEATGPRDEKLFVERAILQDQLKQDLSDYRFSVYASPFTRQSINDGESLRYGFRGGNYGVRYRFQTQFEQQQTKLKDTVTKESVSTRSTFGNAQFSVYHLKPWLSSLSIVNYSSQHFSALGTPNSHWQFGALGFTWHILESKSWEYVDLSYVPLYDVRKTDVIKADGTKTLDKTSGLRHGFRLGLRSRFNETVAVENLLWVRPFQDLATWKLDGGNLNLMNDFKLIFTISKSFFFDYNLILQKDKVWKTLSGLPETNVINSLNMRYDFNL
ncbi:MAG: hypothetical protein ACJ76H_05030 [Bacteriovoracaceae bacterium]